MVVPWPFPPATAWAEGAQLNGRPSLCDVSGKKGTRSTGWKVKGLTGQTEKFFTRASNVSCLPDQRQLVATMGMGHGMTRYIVASQLVITAQLFWREEGSLRQMRSEVCGAQLSVNSRQVSDELL
jgi:hypothetical protein